MSIDNEPATIVGVMPPDFVFPYRGMVGPTGFTRTMAVDAWTTMLFTGPRMVDPSGQLVRNVHYLAAVGRLTPGTSVEQARAGMAAIASRLEQAYPDTNAGWTTTVTPLHEQVVGQVRPALLVLLAGVGVILLMACVNVANLVLARSVGRQKELAVRAALGAGRLRLAQQALTESLLLAVGGGVVGLLVVRWGVQGLMAMAPANLPRLQDVAPDWSVLLVTLGVAVVTGTLVGLVPAIFAGRADVHPALQDSNRGTVGSRSRHRMRTALVVTELALAVVLTVTAGLLLRSFNSVMTLDPGFRPEHLLTMQMSLPARVATPEARRAYYAQWFERLAALPGVTSVGGTTRIPLGSTSVTTSVQVESRPVPMSELPEVEFRRAMHDYFATMGIPIRRGRGFTADDGPELRTGRPRQRDGGAAAVRHRQSGRPARAHRPQSVGTVEHGGRGDRRRPPCRTRGNTATGAVRELPDQPAGGAVHRAAHLGRSGGAGRDTARRGAVIRPDAGALRHPHDGSRSGQNRWPSGASCCCSSAPSACWRWSWLRSASTG